MAKFILTKNKEVFIKVVKSYENAGFLNSVIHPYKNWYLACFEKKRNPEKNFVVSETGNFISVIGTAIFEGKRKSEFMEDVLARFSHELEFPSIVSAVHFLRRELFGNYIVILGFRGEIAIFSDRYHVIPAYYSDLDSEVSITNSCWHLASSLETNILSTDALIEEAFLVAPVSTDTPFENIHKLHGDTYLLLGEDGTRLEELNDQKNYDYVKNLSLESAVEEFSEMVLTAAQQLKKAFSGLDFGLHQTGGLDNRTTFSAMMAVGIKPKTFYGVGNSALTNTNPQDLRIVQEYKNKFDLELNLLDWRHDGLSDPKKWKRQVEQYGFLQSLYGGSQAFFDQYEKQISKLPHFMECGYFGEVLRQREWAYQRRGSKDKYSLHDFINGYLLGGGYGEFQNDAFCEKFASARAHITRNYLRELNKLGMHAKDLNYEFSVDDWNQVEWTHMRNCNSIMCQFLNDYTSSIAMFSTQQLHDWALKLPAKYLQNGKFQLALIAKLFPDALGVAILTHRRPHVYDADSGTLRLSHRSGIKGEMRHRLRKFLERVPFGLKLARGVRGVLKEFTQQRGSETDEALRSKLDLILKNNQNILKTNPYKYNGSLVYYGILAHYIHAISLIKLKK